MRKRSTCSTLSASDCRPFQPHGFSRGCTAPAGVSDPLGRRPTRPPAALFCALLLLAAAWPALAHKVIASAWVEGDEIVGEVGLSNGDVAKEGTRIEVFGPDDVPLGEVFTDGDGLFRFTPTEAVPHRFEVDLGAGHVGEVRVDSDELPIGLGQNQNQGPADAAPGPGAPDAGATPVAGPSRAELEALIARAVQREVLPLRRELAAYREKNDLQGILGGIGYICGIFGLLFFVYGRHQRQARPRAEPSEEGR